MKRIIHSLCALAVAGLITVTPAANAENGDTDLGWPTYGGGPDNKKFAPLGQINADNVGNLELAWRWDSPDNEIVKANPRLIPFFYEATPIVVDGVMYTSTSLCQVAAIDPETGETIWTFDPESYAAGRPTNLGFVNRGVAYWTDGDAERIFIGTGDAKLWSVDAKTGKADEAFGEGGHVDLTKGLRRPVPTHRLYGVTSPPLVVNDIVLVGASIFDVPTSKEMPPGDIRAFNVKTGEVAWTFHNPPLPGEEGYETWEEGSGDYTGNGNVWSIMSADEELGYIYLPFGTPTNDWYGGHRPGDNLFADSLVCVEAETGELVWHYQLTHHGVWDYDLPAAPVLLDITVDGKDIKAVAQVTKQGFLYVFDRVTGEPVWPIEEVEVPESTVPGEKLSKTQPYPTRPAPYERQGITLDDVIDFTPELRAEAMEILSEYNYGRLHTPPVEDKTTLYLPGWEGGGNWCGAAVDPATSSIFIPSITKPIGLTLIKPDAARSNLRYLGNMNTRIEGPQGLPLTKPPYGRITAIDLDSGEHAWQIAHGEGPVHHPALKELNLEPLGNQQWGFPLATKTLLFVTQDGQRSRDMSPDDPRRNGTLRAFDKASGEVVAEMKLPGPTHAAPMTYMIDGRQYIVQAIGGIMDPAALVAYALPGGEAESTTD